MNELFLVAHKVRGQAAFDIAERMVCAVCQSQDDGCHECEGLGYWWIIPTSGHRAYPYWNSGLSEALFSIGFAAEMPPTLRDHYEVTPTKAEKVKPSPSALLKALGLGRAKEPIKRRV